MQRIWKRFSGTNTALEFPCLDKAISRQKALELGPEPNYENIVSGYEHFALKEPFKLYHGGILPELKIAYETWGELNSDQSNAILIHTGLSGSSHAKSHPKNKNPGWWEQFIGPGGYVDTNKFFVICTNVIGGCYGSTGPSSFDPTDNKRYATRFPIVTIFDMVRSQFKLLDSFGIHKLHASVGSSMGGMQSLAASALYPERVGRLISISAAARSHPASMAIRYIQRQALMSDPNWNRGYYYEGVLPHVGMKLARQLATITYRSGPEWEERFGRQRASPHTDPSFCSDYLIETYLDYQSEKFCLKYDANSLLYISKAMDMFNIGDVDAFKMALSDEFPATNRNAPLYDEENDTPNFKEERKNVVRGLKDVKMPALVLGVISDALFPSWQQREIASCLTEAGNNKVTYYELTAKYGHDTFLIDHVNVGGAIKGHLEMS